jgi:hypothetical protein
MTALEPLSPEIERLLAAERKLMPALPEHRARAMARARGALQGRDAAIVRLSWRRVPATLAATLVLGAAALSFAAWRVRHGEDAPPPSAIRAPAPAPTLVSAVARTPDAAPSPMVEGPARGSDATPRAVTDAPAPQLKEDKTAPQRRAPEVDAYAAELVLLQQARAAVAAARFSAALDSISEHERRFPAGRLREERDALRVKALAGLGRGDDARVAAERFRGRYPRSVLSPGIEAATRRAP